MGGDCERMLNHLSAYLDGDLEAASCEAIEAHARACDRCGPLVGGLRESIGLCREAGAVPLPDGVRQRASDRVRRLLDEQTPQQ